MLVVIVTVRMVMIVSSVLVMMAVMVLVPMIVMVNALGRAAAPRIFAEQ